MFIEAMHFMASFTEPGIIPRQLVPIPSIDVIEEEGEDGKKNVITFCKTCRVWRPPRAHHCSDCDNCILEFDHHCPWVGNCVGKRNYRWFNLYLYSLIISAVYIAGVTTLHGLLKIFTSDKSVYEVLPSLYTHIGLDIWCLVMFMTLFGLCSFHCYLICEGKTTYESIKRIQGNPFHETTLFSFYSVFCGPEIPSQIDLYGPALSAYGGKELSNNKNLEKSSNESDSFIINISNNDVPTNNNNINDNKQKRKIENSSKSDSTSNSDDSDSNYVANDDNDFERTNEKKVTKPLVDLMSNSRV